MVIFYISVLDGHHFDNPVYTTYRPGSPLAQLEPLNNVRLVNRLKNTNSDRERERLRAAAAACSQYLEEEDDLSDCTSERGDPFNLVTLSLDLFSVVSPDPVGSGIICFGSGSGKK